MEDLMGGTTPTSLNTAGVRYAAIEADTGKRTPDAAVKDVPVVQAADRFSLSVEASELTVSTTVVDQALTKAYEAMSAGATAGFEAAGKTEYMESIANPTDLSAQATAGRIVGGITGHIFDAFQAQKPEFTAAEFDSFHAAVSDGFEQGLRDAANILRTMSVMTNGVSDDIAETTELVRSGLADFYDSIANSFAPNTPPLQALAA